MLLKLGYSNKTNNPNDSPSKRMFGLFSCGRSDRIRTCGIDVPNVARYQLRHTPIYSIKNFYSSCPLRFLLPLPHRASQKICSRSATAATPYSSLHPPPAALGNVPSALHPDIQTLYLNPLTKHQVLYQRNGALSRLSGSNSSYFFVCGGRGAFFIRSYHPFALVLGFG